MKRVRNPVLLFLGLIVLGVVIHALFAHGVVRAAYEGRSLPILNDVLDWHRSNRPETRNLQFYLTRSDGLLGVYVLACILGLLATLALRYRAHTRKLLSDFLFTPAGPLNLAIFRIVLFGLIISTLLEEKTVQFSRLPREFLVPPPLLEGLLPVLPINGTAASVSITAGVFTATTALLGLFSRTSALLTAIFCVYALGIPQFYGKVNHNHHLIWFAVILSASRCGDALSIDAVRDAFRRADRGITEPPSPSLRYSLPIRFVWILMGVIYFFPGFYKFYYVGFPWALSDSIVFHLQQKWFQLGGWLPFTRLDHVAILPQLGALNAMFFEVSFGVLIIHPTLRIVAAAWGLLFHFGTGIAMNIWFTSLSICYVSFVNFEWLLRAIGVRLFSSDARVVYDGDCRLSRRAIALLRAFDSFGRLQYVRAEAPQDIQLVVGGSSWSGFDAWRRIAPRIPIAWPIVPLLHLWPGAGIGAALYRKLARQRGRDAVPQGHEDGIADRSGERAARPIIAVGSGMVALAILAGVTNTNSGWPIASYPTFAGLARPETEMLGVYAVGPGGSEERLDYSRAREVFGPERFQPILWRILDIEDPEEKQEQLRLLWQVLSDVDPGVGSPVQLRFYRETWLVDPDMADRNPIARELLQEFEPTMR